MNDDEVARTTQMVGGYGEGRILNATGGNTDARLPTRRDSVRIAELEAEVERLTAENDVRLRIIERLRDALVFYTPVSMYERGTGTPSPIWRDRGERARRALLHHDTEPG